MKSDLLCEIDEAAPEVECDQRQSPDYLDSKKMLCQLFEKRIELNPRCLHCNSEQIVKNGYSAGLRRYKCKDCGKTFNALTGTPFARLRMKELWLEYSQCVIDSIPVRKASKLIKVNPKTAFLWRHRFLSTAHSDESQMLSGVVEVVDTFYNKSKKGCKKLKETLYKNEETGQKKILPRKYVSVLVACDRNGHQADYITGLGPVSKEWLESFFEKHLKKGSVLVTDQTSTFKYFCKDRLIEHRAVLANDSKRGDGIYHIQHVYTYHLRLKHWMKRFHGVATKYLNNYLGWNHELASGKISAPIKLITLAFPLKTHLTGT